jgi:hypothetical protein
MEASTAPGYSTYRYPGISGGGGGGAARPGFLSDRGGDGSPGVVILFVFY